MIRKVVYRTNNDNRGYEGENTRNWYGEDEYEVGRRVMGKEITAIEFGAHMSVPFVEVWLGSQVFCEIPMTSVARIYYSLEDGE